jgi:hypothetical protein
MLGSGRRLPQASAGVLERATGHTLDSNSTVYAMSKIPARSVATVVLVAGAGACTFGRSGGGLSPRSRIVPTSSPRIPLPRKRSSLKVGTIARSAQSALYG